MGAGVRLSSLLIMGKRKSGCIIVADHNERVVGDITTAPLSKATKMRAEELVVTQTFAFFNP
jgi:hypothetical protein